MLPVGSAKACSHILKLSRLLASFDHLAVQAARIGSLPELGSYCFFNSADPSVCAQEARRTAVKIQQLLSALEKELPDTAAAMRLTSLEMSDCIGEFSLLG